MGNSNSSSSTSSGSSRSIDADADSTSSRSLRLKWRRGRRRGASQTGLNLDDFRTPKGFVSNIGVGAFGRVLAVEKKDDPTRKFAVKCMHKGKILHKEQVPLCMNELSILRRLDHHAYLCNLYYAFQDREYLYMCTDLMLGGTLQRALRKSAGGNLRDQPEKVCLYTAELVLALQFLHSQNVVHRDVKPENILIDENGHLHLTDFNVSMYIEPGKEETQRHEEGWGSTGHRAPEVYLRTGAGFIFACDWYSLGTVVYEMHVGKVPYPKLTRDEPSSDLLMRMKSESADFSRISGPMAQDLVAKLLRFDPEKRLGCQHGCNSEVMIMAHPYFVDMDWDALERYSYNHGDSSERRGTTENSIEADSPTPTMRDYVGNFDTSLDQKEKLRILQRNMGILGFDGCENDDDEEDYPQIRPDQQHLFQDWTYNVDFKLEQQKMPEFTLLQTVSSMSPLDIKNWIQTCNPESLRALCNEMKAYREQAMKENFDHVMAEMRIDKLIEENLILTRRIAELEERLGIKNNAEKQEKSNRAVSTDEVVLFSPPPLLHTTLKEVTKTESNKSNTPPASVASGVVAAKSPSKLTIKTPRGYNKSSSSSRDIDATPASGSSASFMSPGFSDDDDGGFKFQKVSK